jgi:hypothetical protein
MFEFRSLSLKCLLRLVIFMVGCRVGNKVGRQRRRGDYSRLYIRKWLAITTYEMEASDG